MSYVRNKIAAHTASKNNPDDLPELTPARAEVLRARIVASLRRRDFHRAVLDLLSFQDEINRSYPHVFVDPTGYVPPLDFARGEVLSSFDVARISVVMVLECSRYPRGPC